MDPNRLTQKSQEAPHDAQTKALRFGRAMLADDVKDGTVIVVDLRDGELVVDY
ncbi:hypothetical protein J5X84_11905 [Streptosporangiaceae bacterium NEAU-GS5]|nr:hypothetical protein [Streptosporangiaceae bacterium NEAU-GS5]